MCLTSGGRHATLPAAWLPGQEVPALRTQALADVIARWKEKGWWDQTTGVAAKKAKAIYEELLKASS